MGAGEKLSSSSSSDDALQAPPALKDTHACPVVTLVGPKGRLELAVALTQEGPGGRAQLLPLLSSLSEYTPSWLREEGPGAWGEGSAVFPFITALGGARPLWMLRSKSVFFTTTKRDSCGLLPRVPTLRSQLSTFLLAFGACRWGGGCMA